MNTDIIQGKWHQLKGSVKAQWGKLTDDELDQVDGECGEARRPRAGAIWLCKATSRAGSGLVFRAAEDVDRAVG